MSLRQVLLIEHGALFPIDAPRFLAAVKRALELSMREADEVDQLLVRSVLREVMGAEWLIRAFTA
jgi:hypothetical protein